VEVQL